MDEPRAYLNGEFVPAWQARVSPVDAGFVLGVTIAEQLRTFGGRVFCLDKHLERLSHSLAAIGVEPGVSEAAMAAAAAELVEHNHRLLAAGDDLGLSIFVTPGVYRSYSQGETPGPVVCMHTYPLPFRLWAQKYQRGQALRTTPVRQVPANCWPVEIKCRSRMHYFLADRRAHEAEPDARAVLLDQEGRVCEATTANVLVYRREEGIVSPPLERILHGISLETVGRLASVLGVPMVFRDLRPSELAAADEVLLSSTPFCLLPCTRFDGRPIGAGVPGELYRRLLAAWSDDAGLDIAGQARRFAER